MAKVTRNDPFNETISLGRRAIDRLVEGFLVSPLTWRSVNGAATSPAQIVVTA